MRPARHAVETRDARHVFGNPRIGRIFPRPIANRILGEAQTTHDFGRGNAACGAIGRVAKTIVDLEYAHARAPKVFVGGREPVAGLRRNTGSQQDDEENSKRNATNDNRRGAATRGARPRRV